MELGLKDLRSGSGKYWVILKKVLFGIFTIVLISKEEKNFAKESKGKGLSLSKFS